MSFQGQIILTVKRITMFIDLNKTVLFNFYTDNF